MYLQCKSKFYISCLVVCISIFVPYFYDIDLSLKFFFLGDRLFSEVVLELFVGRLWG